MKHPQHILAFYKEAFGLVLGGVSPMTLPDFLERAHASLMVGRRHELELNEAFGQVLPYTVLYNDGGVFTYQRTSKVGEQRLAGNYSVGIGGHIDASDVAFAKPSVIHVVETFAGAMRRELDEELVFSYNDEEQFAFSELDPVQRVSMAPKFIGIINDTSNEVGRVHYGLLFTMRVPNMIGVRCREDELATIGFLDPNAEVASAPYENWSRLAIDHLKANGLFAQEA
jgi:predicted NUDIX family phosphoesterase